ncbi:MAG: hypothetical protein NC485_00870 [Ruminococcus flavefaciens]|nr:hypothetical protein [Ruminococcus flavefaciens]MCM1061890.1 hypothetical protein [Eubacterium sp.]
MTKQERYELEEKIVDNLIYLTESYKKEGKRFPVIELIESFKTHKHLSFEERTKFLNLE